MIEKVGIKMKKTIVKLISLLLSLLLLAGCIGQKQPVERVKVLENQGEINAAIAFTPFYYTIFEKRQPGCLYDQGQEIATPDSSLLGMDNALPAEGIEPLLAYFQAEDIDELTAQLGQYMYYQAYAEGRMFVFCDHAKKIVHLIAEQSGHIQHMICETEISAIPDFVGRDEDHFYVILQENTEYGRGLIEKPQVIIYAYDFSQATLESMSFQIEDVAYDGWIKDWFVEKGKQYFLIDEYITDDTAEYYGIEARELPDRVVAVDMAEGSVTQFPLSTVNTDFIFWEEGALHWGEMQTVAGHSELILHSERSAKRIILAEGPIYAWFRPFYHQGQLYLDVEGAGLEPYKKGVLVVDTQAGKVLQLIAFDDPEADVIFVRYLMKLPDGQYVDLR